VVSRQTVDPSLMGFHAKYVSAVETGDYYQITFETEDPNDDATDPLGLGSPYLIIQRQFETADRGRCYVETHDHGYVGHYRLKLIAFSPTHLVVAIDRKSNTHVEVTYDLDAGEFDEVRRILNIIFDRRG
jgi:hypothetical protein